MTTKTNFWCRRCKRDIVDYPAWKARNSDGEEAFVSRCPSCNKEVLRLITHKQRDPYYFESKRVILERQRYARDLIQPGQDGFQTFYKKQWEELERTARELEEKELREKAERDAFYKKLAYSGAERQAARAVIEAEEKLEYGG